MAGKKKSDKPLAETLKKELSEPAKKPAVTSLTPEQAQRIQAAPTEALERQLARHTSGEKPLAATFSHKIESELKARMEKAVLEARQSELVMRRVSRGGRIVRNGVGHNIKAGDTYTQNTALKLMEQGIQFEDVAS